jgi:hypothetical protein
MSAPAIELMIRDGLSGRYQVMVQRFGERVSTRKACLLFILA